MLGNGRCRTLKEKKGFGTASFESVLLSRGYLGNGAHPQTSQACCRERKQAMVFFMSIAMVMGPTPPGTGVIQEATGSQGRG